MSRTARPSGRFGHLVRRWWWSMRWARAAPDPDAEAWLSGLLTAGERRWFDAMDRADRRHAIDAALHVATASGVPQGEAAALPRDLVVAAALHDVGKLAADLGTAGRVFATIAAELVPSRALHCDVEELARLGPSDPAVRGWRPRVAAYRYHPEIGARWLAGEGSAPVVVWWARHHHDLPGAGPPPIGPVEVAMLAAADDVPIRSSAPASTPLA